MSAVKKDDQIKSRVGLYDNILNTVRQYQFVKMRFFHTAYAVVSIIFSGFVFVHCGQGILHWKTGFL